jgi:hypothetical protein
MAPFFDQSLPKRRRFMDAGDSPKEFPERFSVRVLLSIVTLLLFAQASLADLIIQYSTANGVTSMAPVATNAAVTGDNMIAGSGLTIQTGGATWNFRDWNLASTSFAAAVAANDFWSWGFDVASLAFIDLTTMDIRLDRSGTGPDDFEIQVSVNGGPGISVLTHNYNDADLGVNFLDVNLSAVPLLQQGDSVVFTLGAYNSESAAGTFDLETITFPGGNDGIVIEGTVVAVPEASAFLFGGMVCGVICIGAAWRRSTANKG